jgi:opacity protein-like surface antigen
MKKNFYLLLFCTLFSLPASAQRWSYGAGLGGSLYHGTWANWHILPNDKELEMTRPALNLQVRYQNSPTFAYRIQTVMTDLRGGSGKRVSPVTVALPSSQFATSIFGIDALVEYNFLNYQNSVRRVNNWTPYFYMGASTVFSKVSGTQNGVGFKTDTKMNYALPFGVGVKYQVSPSWGIQWDFGTRKTFTDALDRPVMDGGESRFNIANGDQFLNSSITITYTIQSVFCPTY